MYDPKNTKPTVKYEVQVQKSESKPRFIRYQSWNTKMYPVWKEGDPRYRNSWTGGDVKFDVRNDAPTLTGARVTFNIDILFPSSQTVQPDGEVVWAKNCIVNGTQRHKGKPVYPQENSVDDRNAVFPDGSPLGKHGDKKPPYVFVWKTCGKYWQVSDGPSSSLTIGTDNIPLGSYVMDVVIYHYRKREKFIPIGYASTQFCITDQIPFAVTLSQVNDKDEGDQKFIRNRAVAFSVALHDPSEYLGDSDITFNWDFGDGSGTVISRELTVTHTYTATGSFKPHVVVQAAIPDPSCATPPNTPTDASPTEKSFLSEERSQPAQLSSTDSPGKEAADVMGQSSSGIKTTPPAPTNGAVDPAGSAEQSSTISSQTEEAAFPDASDTASSASAVDDATEVSGSVIDPDAVVDRETLGVQAAVVIEKREASDVELDCVIYRYGSFSTGIEVIEGIESVEIVQATSTFLMAELEQNAVDFTVTCQGSLPTEVCTVVSDADCLSPVKTVCNTVSPSPECQMVLRHFFNDSGVFCINVSMTNDVSLAVTSARVNVMIAGSRFTSMGTIAMVLGILAVASAVGTVAFAYKRLKGYQPLSEVLVAGQSGSAGWSSVPSFLWSLVNQQVPGQKRSVLLRRVV
ncbi:premelanosome protein b [Colossoma macropomum]|uniref:premelanosome protein b n=1 Tax=Colossoma macropomum TaxID=42526 RepID=UPI0018652010|nr:premelanosome protein b [Colossoma macropomum]